MTKAINQEQTSGFSLVGWWPGLITIALGFGMHVPVDEGGNRILPVSRACEVLPDLAKDWRGMVFLQIEHLPTRNFIRLANLQQ